MGFEIFRSQMQFLEQRTLSIETTLTLLGLCQIRFRLFFLFWCDNDGTILNVALGKLLLTAPHFPNIFFCCVNFVTLLIFNCENGGIVYKVATKQRLCRETHWQSCQWGLACLTVLFVDKLLYVYCVSVFALLLNVKWFTTGK